MRSYPDYVAKAAIVTICNYIAANCAQDDQSSGTPEHPWLPTGAPKFSVPIHQGTIHNRMRWVTRYG
jgi:hypothetical protein